MDVVGSFKGLVAMWVAKRTYHWGWGWGRDSRRVGAHSGGCLGWSGVVYRREKGKVKFL